MGHRLQDNVDVFNERIHQHHLLDSGIGVYSDSHSSPGGELWMVSLELFQDHTQMLLTCPAQI
jgi:hypothetical protein